MPSPSSEPSAAQAFAALQKLTPTQAVEYLQRRNQVTNTYSWQDLWQQEHAQQFTVSRLTRTDLMQALQDQITKSVAGDLSRRDFMRDAKALLEKSGWWGTVEVVDPATGELLKTTFDSARLKLIFDTNTSMAYAAGQWERIQQTKRSHPYLRYITQQDDKVRPAHGAWNNVTLPVDHSFWVTHFPPCGWRCRCRVVSVSQKEYDAGTTPTGGFMRKSAPDIQTRDWHNPRTNQIHSIPVGIDPGFGYNPGIASARAKAQHDLETEKLAAIDPPLAASARADGTRVPTIAKAKADQPDWKTLGLPDLRTMTANADAPPLLEGAATRAQALDTVRSALGVQPGGGVVVQTPVEMVMLLDASLPHVVEKTADARERYANFILPTLRSPTEVWATRYDDATVRHRYIKLFSGAKYDLMVIVRVEPDGSIFWNMMQRDRKKMNDMRVGERVFSET
ncbi:MAG: PBECR2 nuclease fold domain-containing protein [Pseudomonadota bacterium]